MRTVILLDEKDNVATALKDINRGSKILGVTVKADIGAGFKVSLKDIPKGGKIYKYGHVIGIAKSEIKAGERVHIENLSSLIK